MDFEPAYTAPDAEIVHLVRANAEAILKERVDITTSYGSTDTRFWWAEGIPAAVYGTDVFNIGEKDEHILQKEFEDCLKVHASTVVDYLCE